MTSISQGSTAGSAAAEPAALVESPSPAPTGTPVAGTRTRAILLGISRWVLLGSLVGMFIAFSVLKPKTFLSSSDLQNILDQCVVPVMLACGITFVLSVGEFDLSFGATIGLVGGLVIELISKHALASGLAVVIGLAVSLVVGWLIGLLVTFGKSSSFIVTLAIGSALTGLELALTGNQPVYQNIPTSFGRLATNKLGGVHQPVWLAVLVIVLAFTALHGTRFGRHAQSLGGNPNAAYLAGVRIRRIRIICFMVTAFLAALAAVILTARASSYYPDAAGNLLLGTYAAVFLGATAGKSRGFTIVGSVLGVVWLTVLQTGLTLNNAPTWVATLIQGVVLALAVLIGARSKGIG